MEIQGEDLARACIAAAEEIQAEDIRAWKMSKVSSLTDYMIVCSGSSMPHLKAIIREVAAIVHKDYGAKPANSEGKANSKWVVLDYIDVMVHVMDTEMREFYGLEELWADAEEIEIASPSKNDDGRRSNFTS